MSSFNRWLQPMILAGLLSIAGCSFVPKQTASENQGQPENLSEELQIAEQQRSLSPSRSAPTKAKQRFAKAIAAMAAGQWSSAQTELVWLTQHYPKLSGPWLNLALSYQQSGEIDEAEQAFQQALKVNPNNITGYNQFAIFLREQGRFKEAEGQYLQALKMRPQHAESHLNLGILYDLYMGRLDDALQHYRSYQRIQTQLVKVESETKPSRKVSGWIIDLERRVNRMAMK